MDINLEIKVIEKFIVNNKRDRYLNFIHKPKLREKFINELAHFSSQLKDFEEIKGNEWKVIEVHLKQLGNPVDCYIISENREIDGRRMPINEALREVIGYGSGTLLVFNEAELVYYEGEGPSERWISQRIKYPR